MATSTPYNVAVHTLCRTTGRRPPLQGPAAREELDGAQGRDQAEQRRRVHSVLAGEEVDYRERGLSVCERLVAS